MTSSDRFADAVVLAAGSSTRMGPVDKLFIRVEGLPLLAWTVRSVAAAETVRRVIVVTSAERVESLQREPWLVEIGATVVLGGARRQDSVAAGVEAADADVVLVHDGARPLVTPQLVDRVAHAARAQGAAVPVVPLPESLRLLVDGHIVQHIDKTDLYRSQTPHGARRELLLAAYGRQDPRGAETFIDETALVQSAGVTVATVKGEPANLKVTLPGDEELALALLRARAAL